MSTESEFTDAQIKACMDMADRWAENAKNFFTFTLTIREQELVRAVGMLAALQLLTAVVPLDARIEKLEAKP